ncbi:MAG: hypothetical protein H0W25_13010 [Acidimicrobiia bacterium]|nr:hypothetical protein [Acidimicrobiia bacterium]
MARILAAVITGDGGAGDHERGVFAGLAPGFELDATAALGPPGHFELASAGSTTAVKETILLLGWVVAVTDEALGEGEVAVLDAAAAGLGFAPEAAARLKRTAQAYVVEQAEAALVGAGWDPASTAAEVERLAAAIGFKT